MNKIRIASHSLHILFKVLCWLLPIVLAYFTFFHLDSMIQNGMFNSMVPSSKIHSTHFSLIHRAIVSAIYVFSTSITIIVFYQLSKLFHLYERGLLFELETIRVIRNISIFMIANALFQMLCQPLMTTALTYNNPVGQRFVSITLSSSDFTTLLIAFIILVASWIVKEAYQLKAEARLTI
ncbi:MAG: DUF2975 domain-containing protein [Proteobacteria bacterium]|nr:DUF2975 domain-containing protein [Pseudomonadota bacterium]